MTSYWSQRSVRGLLALCLLGGGVASALAASPEQVAAECTRQMSLGICMTKVERSSITPGQTMLLAGVGRVSYAAYLDYVDLNNPKLPTDPAMCQLALRHMTQSPGSDHDKIARALWTPVAGPSESMAPRLWALGVLFLVGVLVLVWGWRRK